MRRKQGSYKNKKVDRHNAKKKTSFQADEWKWADPIAVFIVVAVPLAIAALALVVIITLIDGLFSGFRPRFRYELIANNSEIAIIERRGIWFTQSQIHIPSHIYELPVTTIQRRAFRQSNTEGRRARTTTLPDTITYIGESAFWHNRLTYITIPDSVTHIGAGAFASNRLSSVTISNSLISIEESVFRNNRLTYVTIPDSVMHIRAYAFHGNRLTYITIPDSVTYIGVNAFRNNRITSVTVPHHAIVAESAFDRRVTVIRRE